MKAGHAVNKKMGHGKGEAEATAVGEHGICG
jgi:hypothetical protein